MKQLKIGHHLKYDAHIFANHGIELKGWYFDSMLASYVLNAAATRHGMDDVARVYLSHLTTTLNKLLVRVLNKRLSIKLRLKLLLTMLQKMHM